MLEDVTSESVHLSKLANTNEINVSHPELGATLHHKVNPDTQKCRVKPPLPTDGAEHDGSVGSGQGGLEADAVAHRLSERLVALLGDPVGHGDGRDAARLGDHDVTVAALARLDVLVQDVLTHLPRQGEEALSGRE